MSHYNSETEEIYRKIRTKQPVVLFVISICSILIVGVGWYITTFQGIQSSFLSIKAQVLESSATISEFKQTAQSSNAIVATSFDEVKEIMVPIIEANAKKDAALHIIAGKFVQNIEEESGELSL